MKKYLDEILNSSIENKNVVDFKEEAFADSCALNVLLRDYVNVNKFNKEDLYLNDEHKAICDLFDTYYNVCFSREEMLEKVKPEYREVAEKYYGLELFKKIEKSIDKFCELNANNIVSKYNVSMNRLRLTK